MQRLMSADEQSEIKKLKDRSFVIKYKTEICKNWLAGNCDFGEQCAFAHGYNQLRNKKQQQQRAQKILLSSAIQATQIQYQYMNDKKPRSISEDFVNKYKTELCKNWEMEGYCTFGVQCTYAHGMEELRRKHNGKEVSNLYNASLAAQVEQPQISPYQYYQEVQPYEQSMEQIQNYQCFQQYPYNAYSQQNLQTQPQFYNAQIQQTNQVNQINESQTQLYEQEQYNQQRRSTDPLKNLQTQNQNPKAQVARRGSEQFFNKTQQQNQKPSSIGLKLNMNGIRRLSVQSNASTQISTCAIPYNYAHDLVKINQQSELKQQNNEKDSEIIYVKSLLGDQLLDELEKSPVQYTKRLSIEDKNIKSDQIQQSQSSQDLKTANRSLSYSQNISNQINLLKEYSYFT